MNIDKLDLEKLLKQLVLIASFIALSMFLYYGFTGRIGFFGQDQDQTVPTELTGRVIQIGGEPFTIASYNVPCHGAQFVSIVWNHKQWRLKVCPVVQNTDSSESSIFWTNNS